MTRFKIGDVARILGVTTQALRFFEKEGVVKPHKSDTGTRYYTVDQLVQLLSFRKYRQADFSVQDIVEHFQEDSLASLGERMALRQQALEEQSRILQLRAEAVGLQRRLVADLLHEPEIRLGVRPALRVVIPDIGSLKDATREQLEVFSAYLNAMPATHVFFEYCPDRSRPPHYHLCIREEDALRWQLTTCSTRLIPAVPCVLVNMAFDVPDGENPLETLAARLVGQGYDIVPNRPFFAVHIASETHAGKVRLHAKIFVEQNV